MMTSAKRASRATPISRVRATWRVPRGSMPVTAATAVMRTARPSHASQLMTNEDTRCVDHRRRKRNPPAITFKAHRKCGEARVARTVASDVPLRENFAPRPLVRWCSKGISTQPELSWRPYRAARCATHLSSSRLQVNGSAWTNRYRTSTMDTNTLIIIVLVVLLLGGGGFFYRGRR